MRNPGPARIWLWALPLVLVWAAAGIVARLDRLMRGEAGPLPATAVAAVWTLALGWHLSSARPLWASRETGGFPEAEELAADLTVRAARGDAVITDFVSGSPLSYYLARFGFYEVAGRVSPAVANRLWVVVNEADSLAEARGTTQADRLGIDLTRARPFLRVGDARVYLFGSVTWPPAAPDSAAAGGS